MIGLAGAAPPQPQELRTEELRELMSIGLHAAFNGRVEPALRLFDALGRLRPGESFPRIGTAQALLAARRFDQAVRLLEATLAEQPEDDAVRVMLGLALQVALRESQGRQVLAPLLEADRDAQASRLACELLTAPVTPVR